MVNLVCQEAGLVAFSSIAKKENAACFRRPVFHVPVTLRYQIAPLIIANPHAARHSCGQFEGSNMHGF